MFEEAHIYIIAANYGANDTELRKKHRRLIKNFQKSLNTRFPRPATDSQPRVRSIKRYFDNGWVAMVPTKKGIAPDDDEWPAVIVNGEELPQPATQKFGAYEVSQPDIDPQAYDVDNPPLTERSP